MNDEFGTFTYGKKEMESRQDKPEGYDPRLTAYRPEPYPDQYMTAAERKMQEAKTGEPASRPTNGFVQGATSQYSGYQAQRTTQSYDRGALQNGSFDQGQVSKGSYVSGYEPKKPNPTGGKGPEKKSGTGRRFLLTAALALVFGVIASGVFIGMNRLFGDKKSSTESSSTQASYTPATPDSIGTQTTVNPDNGTTNTISYDVAEIVKKAQPSIVSITTTVTTSYQYYFQQYEREATGAGSGIIIGKTDDYLYIATNYHVIENAKEINVGFNDGQMLKAKVTGYDSNADVAVVQIPIKDIPESTAKAISIAVTGDSDALQVGEPAIAIGNALGYGQSVTVGYISALNRTISGNNGSFYIQTDAAINPGNSGGALFNAKGEVIGINSVKYVDSKVEGMGFSIPINKAMSIINNLIQNGTRGRTYVGITGATVTQEYSQIYGMPIGIYVKSLISDGPAEDAGIRTGDIITAINGKTVETMDELMDALQAYKGGDQVELTLQRASNSGQYSSETVKVTLAQE